MKLLFAVVLLALAMGGQADRKRVVDVATWAYGLGSHGPALINVGPWNYGGVWNGAWNAWNGGYGWNGANGIAGRSVWGDDDAGVDNDAYGRGHDGHYVAANRGSVHIAPLVGHIQSVSSKNLDPAPGTTW